MSLWSREEHRVVLYPDHLVQIGIKRELSRIGFSRSVKSREMGAEISNEGPPWAGSLAALEKALPDFCGPHSRAALVLSNHFLRYLLVPKREELASEEEELALARHSFREVYGNEMDSWELRMSHDTPGKFMIASAVDGRLLAGVKKAFSGARIRLDSIQPHLMTAVNGSRTDFFGKSGWLALAEKGNLCLLHLENNRATWLRSQSIGEDWRAELPRILGREAILAGREGAEMTVLWAPGCEEGGIPSEDGWQIRHSKRASRLCARRQP